MIDKQIEDATKTAWVEQNQSSLFNTEQNPAGKTRAEAIEKPKETLEWIYAG